MNLLHGSIHTAKLVKRGGEEVSDDEETRLLGPFTIDEPHAQVSVGTRVSLNQNYNSVAMDVHVSIPVPPNDKAVKQGLVYCRDIANRFLNSELKGARQLLRNMAGK